MAQRLQSLAWLRWGLVCALAGAPVAQAAEPGEGELAQEGAASARGEEAPEAKKKGKKFRIRLPFFVVKKERKRAEEARREREAREAAAKDAVAVANPEGGVWDWVNAMGGEVPTEEQLAAMREVQAENIAERGLIDELAGHPPPVDYYRDPRAALATHPLYLDLVDPGDYDIPVEVNGWVEKWVRYFTQGNGRKYMQKWLGRASRYQPMMYRALREAELPDDLVYLSMIESGYNAHAYSHAAAAGLWQFMTGTGREYGLRIDWWVDERRDPERSLQAAIAYLGRLHARYDDWRLAWAAYNGGPGRVSRALQRAGTKDWWAIAQGPYLHPETDNYVPKIMAAAIVAKNAERYGFRDLEPEPELVYDVAQVDGSVDLGAIAQAVGYDLEELKSLNPALRRFATPPEGYPLRVPRGRGPEFLAALEALPDDARLQMVKHTVRRGDTLAKIAARYHTSVDAIRSANQLRNINSIAVGWTLVVPQPAGAPKPEAAKPVPVVSSAAAPATPTIHTVRRSQTLSHIAARYGVRIKDLVAWNHLRSASHIVVGQRLKVSAPKAPAPAPPSSGTHVVRRGETLSGIALKHGTTTRRLQQLNGISDPSRIEVGDTLKLEGDGGPTWTIYVVRRGDSLGKIAGAYGVSVASLKAWNQLRSNTIFPGQKIKIRRSS